MKMKVLKIYHNRPLPYVSEIENDLSAFQEFVGGYIEVFDIGVFTNDNVVIVLDEEGKLKGKRAGALLYNKGVPVDALVGDFIVCGVDDDGDFCSLTDWQLKQYKKLFTSFVIDLDNC